MEDTVKLDRIWLCSVVFLDIIQYSRQSLKLQTAWKRRFNTYLAEAIKECPENDRVILDTGDGAAVCFLGDPEMAMFCALRLVGAVTGERTTEAKPLAVRTGINLGSVKLVKDINGNINAVGDGINVGQRVMSFAAENQILVSRSFYEVASSLSENYAALFRYEGVRQDKHVREHTVYELHPGESSRVAAETELIKSAIFTDAQTAGVETHLAAIVGPIASRLLRTATKSATTAEEVFQALLSYIPSKTEQEEFLAHCRKIAAGSGDTTVTHVWEPAALERAQQELAPFMGPMARLLVERAARKTRTRDALYKLLAEEIPSPEDRKQFLREFS